MNYKKDVEMFLKSVLPLSVFLASKQTNQKQIY